MDDDSDIKFMQRALELAALGRYHTRPNPMVGAVIVHKNRIIGEGYHHKSGEPHAEVIAVNSVKSRDLLKESVLYVTLEPCSHYGKTPPCAQMIINEAIPAVVVGTIDTSSRVSGKGVKMMRAAGCEVITGVLEKECRELNKRFFTFHEKGRPYIVLKWAESDDGYMDIIRDDGAIMEGPTWITGDDERILVHKWRAEEHSVIIGDHTAVIDDPALDVRYWSGNNPVRVVLSETGNLPHDLKLLKDEMFTIVFTYSEAKIDGNNVEIIKLNKSGDDLHQILSELVKRDIQSLLVEGGADTLARFISKRMWDEARVFRGKKSFGKGLKAPGIEGAGSTIITFENSTLEIIVP